MADVAIDPPLVRALLHEQHPDLVSLPLSEVDGGWCRWLPARPRSSRIWTGWVRRSIETPSMPSLPTVQYGHR